MATITGRHIINSAQVIEVASNPAAGGGTTAPIGSIALATDGYLYSKSASGDTAWTLVSSSGGGTIGGSIADDQIAVGALANSIEGSAALTFVSNGLNIISGTLGSGIRSLNITGTLATGAQIGIENATTGSGTGQQIGIRSNLLAGNTGTSTIGFNVNNNSAGNGTDPITNDTGNFGSYIIANGTTATGWNVGSMGWGHSGLISIGMLGKAGRVYFGGTDPASVSTIGVMGLGSNNGATPVAQVGVYAGLNASSPTVTSAALMADNAEMTSPIFVARDNGAPVFSIINNGYVEMAELSTPSTPASGFGRLYAKTDGYIYWKNDAAEEFNLASTSSGGTPAGSTGAIQFNSAGVFGADTANLFWDDTNNWLGVGQSTPTTTIHLKDTTLGLTSLRFEGSGNYAGSDWTIYGSSTTAPSANDFLGFFNNSSADGAVVDYKMTIFKTGQVGIGTLNAVPGARFVVDSTAAETAFEVRDSGSSKFSIADGGNITVSSLATTGVVLSTTGLLSTVAPGTSGNVLTSNGSTWTSTAPSGAITVGTSAANSGTTGSVLFVGTGPIIQQDNTNFFFDDSNNRLGIGTNAPANPLHVKSASATGIRIESAGNFTGADWTIYASSLSEPSANDFLGFFNNSTTDSATVDYKLTIYKTGQVGIGTSSAVPGARLTVSNETAGESIFIARDNTTAVLTVADGGDTTIVPVSGHTGDALTITAGAMASTKRAMTITATLDSTVVGGVGQTGVHQTITSTGTGATSVYGSKTFLTVGYTGSQVSAAGYFDNDTAGTGTNNTAFFNVGAFGLSQRSTAGWNVGVRGAAYSSTTANIGVWGFPDSAAGPNVGVLGEAVNGDATVQVGGAFGIRATNDATMFPFSGKVALLADNFNSTGAIFIARDNGTAVFTVANGGVLTQDGGAIFNEAGGDFDFRIEGDTNVNLFFIDASTDRIGIGTASPATHLHLSRIAATAKIESSDTSDASLTVETSGTTATSLVIANSTSGSAIIRMTASGATAAATFLGQSQADATTIHSAGETIMLIGSSATAPIVIGTSDAAAMRIHTNNNISVGTATDLGQFGISNGATSESILVLQDNVTTVLTVADGGGLTQDGGAIFNEAGGDFDFRVESDGYSHMLFIDASVNNIGIRNTAPVNALDVNASAGFAIASVNANTTLNDSHHTILVDATSGSITITLPAVASVIRRRYEIKKIDATANTVVIDGNASETIDGATTFTLTTQYQSATIVTESTAWYII